MGKRKPPKLLSRVIRTVADLKESKGSTVTHIAERIKSELGDKGNRRRNIILEIRRALKYAVEIGALSIKSKKYVIAHKNRFVPVDSLEIAKHYNKRKSEKRKSTYRVKPRHHTRTYQKRTKRVKSEKDTHRSKKSYQKRKKYRRKRQKRSPTSVSEPKQQQQQKPSRIQSSAGTDQNDRESTSKPSTAPGPQEKSKVLDRKNKKPEYARHQTPYPEYNDTMNGDDREGMINVPGKPRCRRPILPTGRVNLNDFDSDAIEAALSDPSNGMTIFMTVLLLLTIWYGCQH